MNVRTELKAGDACYTVKGGDSLSTISQQFFGNMNGDNVARIYFSNQSLIGPDPNIIRPGQKLYIPS